jgi:4-nitrophenyl phosphatase
MVWILDCDGVVWLSDVPIPGSPEAIGRLKAAGQRVMYITNHSGFRVADLVEKLEGMGIEAGADDIVTSAMAAATLVEPGTTALVCGGAGIREALEARGVELVEKGPADAVVVGFSEFDFADLTSAFRAVDGGARLIGSNDDPTYPMPDGPIPGGGAILASVATAAGVEPVVAGKPYEPMAKLVRERLGGVIADAVMVGDRPSTDGLMAERLGVPFALVLTGVTSREDLPVDPVPAMVAADLASLVGPDGELVSQESA